jgi:hypothetical protein
MDEETARRIWQALYRVSGKLARETIGTMAKIPNVAKARVREREHAESASRHSPDRGEAP